jgi:hypothetical protein
VSYPAKARIQPRGHDDSALTGKPYASGGERRNPGSYVGRPRRRHAGGGKSRFFRRFGHHAGRELLGSRRLRQRSASGGDRIERVRRRARVSRLHLRSPACRAPRRMRYSRVQLPSVWASDRFDRTHALESEALGGVSKSGFSESFWGPQVGSPVDEVRRSGPRKGGSIAATQSPPITPCTRQILRWPERWRLRSSSMLRGKP